MMRSRRLDVNIAAPLKVRITWIDEIKGISILLVTLYHAGMYGEAVGLSISPLLGMNDLLTPIRMPLFFAAAGLTAGSALRQSWLTLWHRRLNLYVWLFALWLAIDLIFFWIVGHPRHPSTPPTLIDYPLNLIVPNNELWFLWCLALFYVLTWSGIRRPTGLVIAAMLTAALGFVLSEIFQSSHTVAIPLPFRNALKYFLFFIGAAIYQAKALKLVTGSLGATAALSTGYLFLALLSHYLDGFWFGGGFKLVAAVLGVLMVPNLLVASRRVAPQLSIALAWIGQRTLPIYLLQAPLITLLYKGMSLVPISIPHLAQPLIILVVFVPVALLVQHTALRAGLAWLYAAPNWTRRQREQVKAAV